MLKTILKEDVITNLFYIFAGIFLFSTHTPPEIAISCILLGIGSGIHHGIGSRFTAYLDWIPIYMVFGFLLAHTVFNGAAALIVGAVIIKGSVVADIATKGDSRKKAVALIGLSLLTAIAFKLGLDAFLHISTIFGIAFLPWKIAEDAKHVDHPQYKLLHGIWHIVTSYGIVELSSMLFEVTKWTI